VPETAAPGPERAAGRLDNFVDGAFAFALTLLVIAESSGSFGYGQLIQAMWRIPAFAAGFALIANFWFAHVSWRRAGGGSDTVAVLLSLALVFCVLVYVQPVRVMTGTLTQFLTGTPVPSAFSLRGLFTLYGIGFATMSGLTAALFWHSGRRGELDPDHREGAVAWGVVAGSGVLSTVLAQLPLPWLLIAPWCYAALPIAVPLAVGRSRRRHAAG
jgi:uncharacterized membrane protein